MTLLASPPPQCLSSSVRLLVALSGGLDSIVLLHLLSQHPDMGAERVHAMHIHHGLHADAKRWTTHCQTFCDALGVPLQIADVDVARDGGDGLEAAARRARYAAFADALSDGDVLVTAHHRDDQAETFLLRALRASGPDGLASMRPWRTFATGWHWRPLLEASRSTLLAYSEKHGLGWIDDPSNADTAHDRNFLRHDILPLLRARWPQADAAFARSASLSAEAVELLADEDASALAAVRTGDARVVSVDALKRLSTARRARVLRRWIAELGLPPLPSEGVVQIQSQLLVAGHDTEAAFAWSGVAIRRWRDVLHAELQRDDLPMEWRVEWDGASALLLPTGDLLKLMPFAGAASVASSSATASQDQELAAEAAPTQSTTRLDPPVIVHARRGGERITLPGRDHSHALKHALQDLGVPPWVRARLPLVSSTSGELLALGDLACSAGFETWLRGHGVRLSWIKDSSASGDANT